jgi:ribA/ribD-fused uncharacterized protein
MENPLFNEVGINPGETYKFGDWKGYAIHDDKKICGFFGEFRFLSNFEYAPTYYEGILYPTSENAYQAAKIVPEQRAAFVTCSAAASKKLWKTLTRLDKDSAEWDARKLDVMNIIVFDKFYRNKDLRVKLLNTHNKYLEETLHWCDVFWGVDIRKGGENNLGKILTKVRAYWQW